VGTGLSIIFYSTIACLSTILGIAFFPLFPESLELSEHAVLFIFAGFLLFYLLENVTVVHSGSEIHFKGKGNPQHTKGMVTFSGLFFHSLRARVSRGCHQLFSPDWVDKEKNGAAFLYLVSKTVRD
jgi:hypothetical protein